MKYGYIRVSEISSSVEEQSKALLHEECERLFTDLTKDGQTSQDGLQDLLASLKTGDVLVVHKLDRLGGSLRTLIELLNDLFAKKVELISIEDRINTTLSQGDTVKSLVQVMSIYEKDRVRERNKVGLTAARARGRKGGRPRSLDNSKIAMAKQLFRDKKNTIAGICEIMKISRATLYRYLKS
tara:strand:- start:8786 stop:9334 length:549 start_codon:yes stop_codon:yes gene_type:complete